MTNGLEKTQAPTMVALPTGEVIETHTREGLAAAAVRIRELQYELGRQRALVDEALREEVAREGRAKANFGGVQVELKRSRVYRFRDEGDEVDSASAFVAALSANGLSTSRIGEIVRDEPKLDARQLGVLRRSEEPRWGPIIDRYIEVVEGRHWVEVNVRASSRAPAPATPLSVQAQSREVTKSINRREELGI